MYIHVYTIHMTTKLQKWGNSLGVRIPKEICESVGLHEATEIEFVINDGIVGLRPQKKITRFKYSLKELCDKITPENRHELADFGRDVGREIW